MNDKDKIKKVESYGLCGIISLIVCICNISPDGHRAFRNELRKIFN